ncbi:GSCFA domain-containing protein [Winogradskyella sp. 3972H.M.0a.05]|uniref:GSCFA domain-containing protein n=1 Tax=Winogradskyella sp. 3972H.M.0a.05 TaxID=2950277 RepID=UPI003397327D
MEFQTKISIPKQQHDLISYQSKLLLTGSCFAEHIGEKFDYYKFQSTTNPLGILFHPLAVEQLITNAVNEKRYQDNDVFSLNEQWHSYEAHSRMSTASKDELLSGLNNAVQLTHKNILEASHVIITLGTAWVYRHIETDTIVANCHKVPQKKFLKELLSVDAIKESLEAIISLVRSVNPKTTFIFTVSPVRHLKDGFVENKNSKANLISAIHQVVEPRKHIYYFPSYEIMMDELRDYRFYSEDMIHPNALAVNHIWERFKEVWIDSQTYSTMDDVETIQKGLAHRPFNPNSEAHQKFLQDLEEKKNKLQQKLPFVHF